MACFIYLLVQGCVVWKNAHQSKICGDYYGSFKKILAILVIFCVLVSAGAVCAADDFGQLGSNYADDSGYVGSNYQDYDDGIADDDSGYAGSNYQDDGGWAGSQYNETLENATAQAAGEPTNATNATNITAQAAGEPTNATNATGSVHSMLATGNPILILLVVAAVLGGYVVYKRR
ncbi:MAG: hypothetical protein VZR10_08095 [Methanobrevibacter sp.]|nr:hypothetical protein [Methanobrevibacter sp.]